MQYTPLIPKIPGNLNNNDGKNTLQVPETIHTPQVTHEISQEILQVHGTQVAKNPKTQAGQKIGTQTQQAPEIQPPKDPKVPEIQTPQIPRTHTTQCLCNKISSSP